MDLQPGMRVVWQPRDPKRPAHDAEVIRIMPKTARIGFWTDNRFWSVRDVTLDTLRPSTLPPLPNVPRDAFMSLYEVALLVSEWKVKDGESLLVDMARRAVADARPHVGIEEPKQ